MVGLSPFVVGTLSTYWSRDGLWEGSSGDCAAATAANMSSETTATTPARRTTVLPTALVAVGTIVLSLDGGSSPVTTRSVVAIVAWWAILLTVAFSLWPRAGVPRSALVCGALLVGLTILTGLSAFWAPSAEAAFGELSRLAMYTALFLLPVLAARRGDGGRWLDGLAIGIAVVAILALAQRLFPDALPDGGIPELLPAAATRLSYPLGYWNGLAILLALGVPPLLRLAAATAPVVARGAAVAALPAIAGAVYLTSSRGGVAVAAVGIVVFLAATARRFAALQALVVGAIGAAVAITVLRGRPELVDGPPGSAAAVDAGPGVAVALIAIFLACGAVYALVSVASPPRLRLPRPAVAAVVALLVVLAGAAVIAADPSKRFEDFKAPPGAEQQAGTDFVQSHLVSSAGSGRWQFWGAAADQWRERPAAGDGAGSFAPWWLEHNTIGWFVRNAHSLWLETLAELGVLGLLLLAGAFVTATVAGLRRLRAPARRRQGPIAARGAGGGAVSAGLSAADDEDAELGRSAVAATLGVIVAFAAGASLDWIWQVPAIAAVGLVALGLATGPATARGDRIASRPGVAFAPRAALVILAWVALATQAIPLITADRLAASRDAATRGDEAGAAEHARAARGVQPWAASPYTQLALLDEQRNDLRSARVNARRAIDRSPRNWRLRVIATRLAVKAGDVRAARRELAVARRLNPRSPALARIGKETGG